MNYTLVASTNNVHLLAKLCLMLFVDTFVNMTTVSLALDSSNLSMQMVGHPPPAPAPPAPPALPYDNVYSEPVWNLDILFGVVSCVFGTILLLCVCFQYRKELPGLVCREGRWWGSLHNYKIIKNIKDYFHNSRRVKYKLFSLTFINIVFPSLLIDDFISFDFEYFNWQPK